MFTDNKIRGTGAKALTCALKKNTTLTQLNLDGTEKDLQRNKVVNS